MRPLSLRLRGFIGIRSGLGREEVTIDLADLSGLVALVAANGSGKTTILDNLHPYRLMPYALRDSDGWSPRAYSYYDDTEGQAEKELVFEHGGRRYRSLILIDAARRAQEAYLYREESGQWVPHNEAVKSGKTGPYDEAIVDLVGTPTLYFSAIYRGQGAKTLAECKRAEVMDVVTELLAVKHVTAQGDKARKAAGIVTKRLEEERSRLAALESDLAVAPALRAQIAQGQEAVAGHKQTLAEHRAEQEQATAYLGEIHAKVARNKEHVDRKQALEAQRPGLLAEATETVAELAGIQSSAAGRRQTLSDRIEGERTRIGTDRSRSEQELAEKEKSATDRKAALQTRRDRLGKILAVAEKIRAAAQEEGVKRTALAEAKTKRDEIEATLPGLRKEEAVRQGILQEIAVVQGAVNRLKTRREAERQHALELLAGADETIALLGRVPCSGSDLSAGCELLQSAKRAQAERPNLAERARSFETPGQEEADAGTRLENLQVQAETLSSVPDRLRREEVAASECKATVATLERELDALAKWTVALPELEQADATALDLDEQEAGIDAELAQARERHAETAGLLQARADDLARGWATETAEIDADVAQRSAAVQTRQQAVAERLATLDTQIATERAEILEDPGTALAQAEERLTAAGDAVACAEKQIASALSELWATQGKLDALTVKEPEAEALRRRVQILGRGISTLTLLARGCSNDGIAALELDEAGPGISAVANDLLRDYDGGRWSIRLETQRETQKGAMAETFDVTVFDAQTGLSASLFKKSGGQVVYLNDAIVRAFRLYKAGQSTTPYLATFSDESDGALDPERRQEFLELKRRALAVGDYKVEYFVSHTREVQEAADGAIVIGDVPEDLIAALRGPVVRVERAA